MGVLHLMAGVLWHALSPTRRARPMTKVDARTVVHVNGVPALNRMAGVLCHGSLPPGSPAKRAILMTQVDVRAVTQVDDLIALYLMAGSP